MGVFQSKNSFENKKISDKEILYTNSDQNQLYITSNLVNHNLVIQNDLDLQKKLNHYNFIIKIKCDIKFVIYDIVYHNTIDHIYSNYYIKLLTQLNQNDIEICYLNPDKEIYLSKIYDIKTKKINMNELNDQLQISAKIIFNSNNDKINKLLTITNVEKFFTPKNHKNIYHSKQNLIIIIIIIITIVIFMLIKNKN